MNDDLPPRPLAATLVLLGCASVVAAHLAVLYTSGLDPVSTPLGALSRSEDGHLHGLGLSLFALAHVALAALLRRRDAGRATRLAQLLILVDAALVVYLAYRFGAPGETASGAAAAGAPLWALATGTGTAMTLLVPGLLGSYRAAGLWNLGCLLAWVALAPLYLVVEADWLGAYQRLVGVVFVAWMVGLAVLVGFRAPRERHPKPRAGAPRADPDRAPPADGR